MPDDGFVPPLRIFKTEIFFLLLSASIASLLVGYAAFSIINHFAAISRFLGRATPFHLRTAWLWLKEHQFAFASLGVLLTLLSGAIVAAWKRLHQSSYGLCEIVFGGASAFNVGVALFKAPNLAAYLGVGTSVYIISRGLNNYWDAKRG